MIRYLLVLGLSVGMFVTFGALVVGIVLFHRVQR